LSADGRSAVSGASDKTVRVWDLASGQCRATLQGHTHWVRSVALSADGRSAVSGASDNTVRVWDLASGQCRATFPSDSPEARRAWASVRGAGVFSAQCRAHFLEIGTAGADEISVRFPGNFTAADCSPDGRSVIAGDGSGQVYFLRLRSRND
jgi:hypothetical protein